MNRSKEQENFDKTQRGINNCLQGRKIESLLKRFCFVVLAGLTDLRFKFRKFNLSIEKNCLQPAVHYSLKRKFAFTLAEVLITLGIIGVVAAMTIPVLVTSYKKKVTAVAVKRTYAELNQILDRAIADYGEPQTWGYYGEDELDKWVQTYFVPYVNGAQHMACKSNQRCFGLPLPYPLGQKKLKNVNYLAGQYVVTSTGIPVGYAFFRYEYGVTRVRCYIRKPYNGFAEVGKDVFMFILTTADDNPRFKPYGYGTLGSGGMSTTKRAELLGKGWGGCNEGASGSGYFMPGDACAAVIMLDDWKIEKDYPW